jgi:hypothetical protein
MGKGSGKRKGWDNGAEMREKGVDGEEDGEKSGGRWLRRVVIEGTVRARVVGGGMREQLSEGIDHDLETGVVCVVMFILRL